VPLFKKADLVPRMVPFLNFLRELAPKGKEKFPHTEKLMDREMQVRMDILSKVSPEAAMDVERTLKTLAPAAQQPPEEA